MESAPAADSDNAGATIPIRYPSISALLFVWPELQRHQS